MEPVKSRTSLLIVFIIFAGFFFGAGYLVGKDHQVVDPGTPFTLRKINQVYEKLQEDFIFKEELDREKLEYGAAKGFVEAVGDPYTYFLDPEESEAFEAMINGSFEGIGAEIGTNDQREIVIIAPLEGTPAKRSGVRPQDVVIQIDDTLTVGLTLDEAVSLIRGEKGTTVILLVRRESLPEPIEISIIRDIIEIPTLRWELMEGHIAYIQLFNFNERSSQAFADVAKQVLGSSADTIILDLRGNPGGILQEAVAIGGWFVSEGKPIALERFADKRSRTYASEGPATLKGFPLVVLIDKGSASASEILAGALDFHNDALLVGESTFGKGTVQIIEEFSDGSSLRVTISQWLLPDGKSIGNNGLTPDEPIARGGVNDEKDRQLERAIELLGGS